MKALIIFNALLFLLTLSLPPIATAQGLARDEKEDDEIFMVVLGDSATLGVWADIPLGHPKPSFYAEIVGVQFHAALLALLKGERINDLSNAQRYADTIDRNFSYITHKQWSGLIGNQPYALAQIIKREWGKTVKLFNASILAGCYQLSDLLFRRVEDFYRKNPTHRDPDLVIVHFNAMDFIFGTTERDFSSHVRRLFSRLSMRFPHATFIVTPLIDIINVMTDSFEHITIPGAFGLGTMTCADTYRKVGFGSIIRLDPTTPAEHVTAIRDRWTNMQRLLEEEIELWDSRASDNPAYMPFEGRVFIAEPVTPASSSWAPYLAVDCIHPNIEGQKQIAASIWKTLEIHGVNKHLFLTPTLQDGSRDRR